MHRKTLSLSLAVVVGCAAPVLAKDATPELNAVDTATVQAISSHLGFESVNGIDFSAKSKEYCLNAGLPSGGHMTHYSIDPQATTEDIVDFVRVDQFVGAGLDVDALPRHPGTLGSMKAGQWYYVPAGSLEPHHGTKLPFDVIVRATDVR